MVDTPSHHVEPLRPSLYERIQDKLDVSTIHSDKDLAHLVETRLPIRSVAALVRHGFTDTEVYALVLPRRTLVHRKTKREALSREESDRAVRLARITALAESIFGDQAKAFRWLRKPKRRFEDRAPIQLLATEAGARLVEEMLYQIDEGMAA